MSFDRREFLVSAAALAATARTAPAGEPADAGPGLPASVRADFPSASAETYFNSAGRHPPNDVATNQVGGAAVTKVDILELARTDRRNLFDRERLLGAIRKADLDAVVATGPNTTYTGGVYTPFSGGGRVVTTAEGKQGIVVGEAEGYHFREYSWVDDVRTYRSASAPSIGIGLLADLLRDLGLANARVGIEIAQLTCPFNEQLRARLPKVQWADAKPVFDYARLVKTPGEIDLYREACRITMKAIQTAWAVSRPGDTEKQVAARMQGTALELGADWLSHCHLHAGIHSTIAHTNPGAKPFLPGEAVHIDLGAYFGGYGTDLARNAVVVGAKREQETIYKKLWEIQHKLFDKVKPGAVVGEFWDFGQQEFARVGLVHPWGTMGHGTGLQLHEQFEIAKGSQQVLEAGMLITIEPSHIEKGDARYHIEDTLLVTKTGYELLSDLMDSPVMTVIR